MKQVLVAVCLATCASNAMAMCAPFAIVEGEAEPAVVPLPAPDSAALAILTPCIANGTCP
jgi:hypothetical protein